MAFALSICSNIRIKAGALMDLDAKREKHFRMLDVELGAARKLSRKLQQILWKDMAKFEPAGLEFVIAYLLFLRAERTFSSLRTLARLRMVDDAFALVRVMVEKIINAEYILLAGTDTALDYIQFQAFREWRDIEEFQDVSPEAAPKYTAEVVKLLRNAHDRAKMRTLPDGSQKHRFGRGYDWIDMGLSKRAESVDEALRAKFSMKTFKSTRILFHSTYKKGAGYLHGMFASLARSLESERSVSTVSQDGKTEMKFGIRIKDKDPRVAVAALKTANLAAFAMILFVGKVFDKKTYLEWASSFKAVYLENRRRVRGGL